MKKNTPNIEQGNVENIKQIVDLNYEIFKGIYEDKPYSLKHYKEKLKNKNPIIFISKKSNKITGNSISFKKNNSFYIWIVGVAEKHRGQGIGNLLLEKNEQFAQKNGYKSISTKVYNISEKMQQLLKRRGYQIIKIKKSKINKKYDSVQFELKFK